LIGFKGAKTMTINPLPSSNPITLEAVKIQFDHWRATRAKGSKMPKHLWEALAALTRQHTYGQLASELKINPHRLRSKLEKQSQQASPLSKSDFVEVPLAPFPAFPSPCSGPEGYYPYPHAQGTFEFTRPDGTSLKASGLNHDHLCALVKSFLGQ
jgi:hypothetical protein